MKCRIDRCKSRQDMACDAYATIGTLCAVIALHDSFGFRKNRLCAVEAKKNEIFANIKPDEIRFTKKYEDELDYNIHRIESWANDMLRQKLEKIDVKESVMRYIFFGIAIIMRAVYELYGWGGDVRQQRLMDASLNVLAERFGKVERIDSVQAKINSMLKQAENYLNGIPDAPFLPKSAPEEYENIRNKLFSEMLRSRLSVAT